MLGGGGGGREDIPWPQVKLGAVPGTYCEQEYINTLCCKLHLLACTHTHTKRKNMHRHAYAQQCTNTNHIHNKAGRIQTKCIKSSSGKYTHIYFVYLYHNYNTNTPLGITAHYYPPAATSGDDSQGLSSKERLKPGIRPASLPTQTTSTTPPPSRTILPLT